MNTHIRWHQLALLPVVLLTLSSCSSDSSTPDPDTVQQGGNQSSVAERTGETLYSQPHSDGNTFACQTCHALSEPAADGLVRPGHEIGTAAARPSFKNGQLDNLLAAVNICRTEWMQASAWDEANTDWQRLEQFLIDKAPASASAIEIQLTDPLTEFANADVMRGQQLFNGRCIVCHGENGLGTERAPRITGFGLSPDYVAERVRLSGRTDSQVYPGRTGGRMPFWSLDRLSNSELLDIATYVNVSSATGDGNTVTETDSNGLRDCPSTHEKIGQSATLVEQFHDVGGTATIIDDCTIQIDNFTFDGRGIDVQIYGGRDGDYTNGFSMSRDIRRDTAYSGETLTVQLSESESLDDFNGISVWCVPVGASFGDGQFE